MSYGKIHDGEKAMFFREHCGEAKDDKNGRTYELSVGVGGGSPIVHCKETNKWFTLGWPDIINMAVDAGIAEKEEDAKCVSSAQGSEKSNTQE